ncbi:hypothetical protein [Prosthecobacter sp.]|uniref:hypothetical protein n=1 Tax=Prosthecobacter sp. TaxID=1965333 RepID=UPI00378350F1
MMVEIALGSRSDKRERLRLCCLALLPNGQSCEQTEGEHDSGNHRRLDAEGKDARRHPGLQVDIDGQTHLNDEAQTSEQEKGLSEFCEQGSTNPWQQEQASGGHFPQFSSKNGLVGQVALLDLNLEPSMDRLEKLEESKHEHQDSQEEGQGLDEALEMVCGRIHRTGFVVVLMSFVCRTVLRTA